jgi:hypothetical protein
MFRIGFTFKNNETFVPSNLAPQFSAAEYNTAHLTEVSVSGQTGTIKIRGYYGFEIDNRYISYDLALNRLFSDAPDDLPKLEWVKVWINRGQSSYFGKFPYQSNFNIESGSTLELAVGYGAVPSLPMDIPTDYIEPTQPQATIQPINENEFIIYIQTLKPCSLIPNLVNVAWSVLNPVFETAGYSLISINITDTNILRIRIKETGSITLAALIPLIIAALITIAVIVVSIQIRRISDNNLVAQKIEAEQDIIKRGLDAGLTADEIKGLLGELPSTSTGTGTANFLSNPSLLILGLALIIAASKK